MLSYLVQAQQRAEMNNRRIETKYPSEKDSKNIAAQFKKQDETSEFLISEKNVLPKVEEVDEMKSQASEKSLNEIPQPKNSDKLDQLQFEIIEAQSKLFRLQAQYNDQLASKVVSRSGSIFMAASFARPTQLSGNEVGYIEDS